MIKFDYIMGMYPDLDTEEKFKKWLGKGIYEYVFDNKFVKKQGTFLASPIEDIQYNVINTVEDDYILMIKINEDTIDIEIRQNNLTQFKVESLIGTIGDQFILSSIPIDNFGSYISDTTNKYLLFSEVEMTPNVVKEDEEIDEQKIEIQNNLKKLIKRN